MSRWCSTGAIEKIAALNVSLTPGFEAKIREEAASGRYNNASEVVREALRLREAEDRRRAERQERLRLDLVAA